MTLLESIRAAQDGQALRSLARRFGLSQGELDQAMRALVPEFGPGLRRLAEKPSGEPAAHRLVAEAAYERYLDEPHAIAQPSASEDGEQVLRAILDSEHERREVARSAAGAADLTQETVARLMPLVAALTMGALGRSIRESSPTAPGRFGTRPEDTSGDPLARALASAFGDEDVSIRKKP